MARQADLTKLQDLRFNTGNIDNVKINPTLHAKEMLQFEERAVHMNKGTTLLRRDPDTHRYKMVSRGAQTVMDEHKPIVLRKLRALTVLKALHNERARLLERIKELQTTMMSIGVREEMPESAVPDVIAFLEDGADVLALPTLVEASRRPNAITLIPHNERVFPELRACSTARTYLNGLEIRWYNKCHTVEWPALTRLRKPFSYGANRYTGRTPTPPEFPNPSVVTPYNDSGVRVLVRPHGKRVETILEYGRLPRSDPAHGGLWISDAHPVSEIYPRMPSRFLMPTSGKTELGYTIEAWSTPRMKADQIVASFPEDIMLREFPDDARLRAFYQWYNTVATDAQKTNDNAYIEPFTRWHKGKVATRGLQYAAAMALPGPSRTGQPEHIQKLIDDVRRTTLYARMPQPE